MMTPLFAAQKMAVPLVCDFHSSGKYAPGPFFRPLKLVALFIQTIHIQDIVYTADRKRRPRQYA
jgi:hypothetical protein